MEPLPENFVHLRPSAKYHYFIYGKCGEGMLSDFIAAAEEKGCEFMQMIPSMEPLPSGLALPPGAPKFIMMIVVFVRIEKDKFPACWESMQADASKERQAALSVQSNGKGNTTPFRKK